MLFEILNIIGAIIALLNTVVVFCALKVAGDADRLMEEMLENALYAEPMDADWSDETDG